MAAQNDLLAFGWSENGWKYKGRNASALPQIEDPILLGLPAQDEGTRFSSFYVLKEEIMENFCVWIQKSDGTFQTNLHYFNRDTFPKTVKEAREKLSNPPAIPTGTLSAKKIQFTPGEKYEVYQGPGEEYGRAGSGKAIVSTNDRIQVFDEENGWILIQYDISSEHMRIGWISLDALHNKTSVDELTYSSVLSKTNCEVNLTDDPLNSQASIATHARGTKVTWLASMGEWAYIESAGIHPIRGFVKTESLEFDKEAN